MNNRHLLLIFLSVVAIFIGAKLVRKDHSSSFDPVLSAMDTLKVDRIHFSSPEENQGFDLIKEGAGWKAMKGETKIDVPLSHITPLLTQLHFLRADRIVTKDASRYPEYEITDQQASRIMVFEGNKEVTHLLLGGFRFDPQARTASAFARKKNSSEVYEVDGFALMGLKQSFDQYRDKTIVKAEVHDLTKIEWTDNTGRKEALSKEDGLWHYAGMEAVDTSRIQTYLQNLVTVQGERFSTLSSIPNQKLAEKITLYGNNMIEPIVVSAYLNADTTNHFLIHSSLNREAIFLSDSLGIYKRIFGDLRQFWPDGQ